jgi:lipopolysaccharide export LptBFGC system permease protein LptF
VELEYWQKVLERSEQGHFDEGRMATDEGVEVLERKGEESKEQSLRVNDLTTDAEGPLQATTSIRQRTRPASAWHVKPDNSNHSDNPGNLDNTTLTSQSRRREHDVLLDDLVHMATRLKERNYALQLHVSKDKTIDTADLALSTNAARFHTQHGELKQFTRKSWATLWRLIILMLLVVVSMLVMFMLIVVTKK